MSEAKGRSVVFFPTCLVDTVAPEVGQATVRVLRRVGCDVELPPGATCCGQPAWNAGFAEDAARVARTTLAALEASAEAGATVCVPAGSCATMIRVFWPELFELVGDHDARDRARALAPKVEELSEFLAGSAADRLQGTFPEAVAYHHSCHMLRELGIRDQPVGLIEQQEGAKVVAWDGADRCCGFGGLFSVKQPELSVAMADDKLAGVSASGAAVLAGCDSSCLMHLKGRAQRLGLDIEVLHLAELLERAVAGHPGERPAP